MTPIKVVAFSSSPRTKGNSDILAEEILQGAAEAGALAEKVRLHGLKIQPCTACDVCQKTILTPCVIKDDMAPLADQLRAADAYVFASPIYFCMVNAQMKIFLDRWYALFGEGTADTLRGKHMALVFAYGDKDPFTSGAINALRMFQDAAQALGIKLVGWLSVSCARAGQILDDRAALTEARLLGHKLIKSVQTSRPK